MSFVAYDLLVERRYQQSVAAVQAKGEPIPCSQTNDRILDIYRAPSSAQAVDIKAAE